MNIWHFRNELAKNLPYGDQRRVEIARALATDPKLLILDEPAAGLNEQESAELMALIRQIRDMGVTIFLIEHDMKVVMGVSDRVDGAGQRREDRRGHARRGAGEPARDRGLPGPRRGERRHLSRVCAVQLQSGYRRRSSKSRTCTPTTGTCTRSRASRCRSGQGEIVALIGANGAGKSTTLRDDQRAAASAAGRDQIGGQVGRRHAGAPDRLSWACRIPPRAARSSPRSPSTRT